MGCKRMQPKQYLIKINSATYTPSNPFRERIHGLLSKTEKNRWGDMLIEGSKKRADRVGVRARQACSLKEHTRLTPPTVADPNNSVKKLRIPCFADGRTCIPASFRVCKWWDLTTLGGATKLNRDPSHPGSIPIPWHTRNSRPEGCAQATTDCMSISGIRPCMLANKSQAQSKRALGRMPVAQKVLTCWLPT